MQQNILQIAGLCGEDAIFKVVAVGEAKIDAVAAKAVERRTEQIAGLKMHRQKVDGRRGDFCDIMEFVTGKDKHIAVCDGVGLVAHTISAGAGQNVGNLKLGVSVLGDGAGMKRRSCIIHFQQDIAAAGTDFADLLLHLVPPFRNS